MGDKQKSPRGRNYDPIEDQAIARAWVRITSDSAVGIYQTNDRFWERVKAAYEADDTIADNLRLCVFEERSALSMQSRFSTIAKENGKFMKSLKHALATLESGKNDRDAYIRAMSIYQQTHPKKKTFEFGLCHEILSNCPKFCLDVEEEQSPEKPSKRKAACGSDEEDALSPVGIKKAKQMKHEKQLDERRIAIGTGLKRASEERNTLLRAYVMQTIFTATPVSDQHARFLELQRTVFMRELEAQAQQKTASEEALSDHEPSESVEQEAASEEASFPAGSLESLADSSAGKDRSRTSISAICNNYDDDDEYFDVE